MSMMNNGDRVMIIGIGEAVVVERTRHAGIGAVHVVYRCRFLRDGKLLNGRYCLEDELELLEGGFMAVGGETAAQNADTPHADTPHAESPFEEFRTVDNPKPIKPKKKDTIQTVPSSSQFEMFGNSSET